VNDDDSAGLDIHAQHFEHPWQRVEALFQQMELDNPERLKYVYHGLHINGGLDGY